MTTRELSNSDPTKLVKHRLSVHIYGDSADEGFDESIARRGVDEPIVIAADRKTIISGVRRRNAAIKASAKTVPVIVRKDLTEDIDIREAIIEANRHNEKSVETRAREFKALKEIEAERARNRQKTSTGGTSPQLSPNLDEAEKGRADAKAAEQVGMKKTTARKAAEVVTKIDEAEAAGDAETAEDLRETLNTKSVTSAHRKVICGNYQAAFDKLPNVVKTLLEEKPSLATEPAVIKMATMDVNELTGIARDVRVGNVAKFDDVVKPSKNESRKAGKAKPAKGKEKPSAAKLIDQLIRAHFSGASGLPQGIDKVAELNGGKGDSHKTANDAMNDLLKTMKTMRAGER